MNKLLWLLEDEQLGQAYPHGEPAPVPTEGDLTEPNPSPDNTDAVATGDQTDLYSLYPDLSKVDPTDPAALAQFFANIAQQAQNAKNNNPNEFI